MATLSSSFSFTISTRRVIRLSTLPRATCDLMEKEFRRKVQKSSERSHKSSQRLWLKTGRKNDFHSSKTVTTLKTFKTFKTFKIIWTEKFPIPILKKKIFGSVETVLGHWNFFFGPLRKREGREKKRKKEERDIPCCALDAHRNLEPPQLSFLALAQQKKTEGRLRPPAKKKLASPDNNLITTPVVGLYPPPPKKKPAHIGFMRPMKTSESAPIGGPITGRRLSQPPNQ